MLYWIEAVEIVTAKRACFSEWYARKSGDESNPPMLQALVISVTSAGNQLEAEWKWYSSAIHDLNAKIIVNTKWILINDSKY